MLAGVDNYVLDLDIACPRVLGHSATYGSEFYELRPRTDNADDSHLLIVKAGNRVNHILLLFP